MEAYAIHVIHTDKLNYHTWEYFEKNELSIGVNGRLVHISNEAYIESRELAEQYRDAIKAKRMKSGDKEFDAEVVTVSTLAYYFPDLVKKHSETVRENLKKWNYPTTLNITFDDTGWRIRVQHDERKDEIFYLLSLGKDGSMKLCNAKDGAKIYKQESFVQKALNSINDSPKFRAFAVKVE